MNTINDSLQFFIHLAKAKTIISRRFDNRLSFCGIGFNEFIIMYYISQSPEKKMRRIDIAEKIGLTASGITRILLPMEKIGLIKKEKNTFDARVSYVMLAPGGERILKECIENADLLAKELLPAISTKKMKEYKMLFIKLGETTIY